MDLSSKLVKGAVPDRVVATLHPVLDAVILTLPWFACPLVPWKYTTIFEVYVTVFESPELETLKFVFIFVVSKLLKFITFVRLALRISPVILKLFGNVIPVVITLLVAVGPIFISSLIYIFLATPSPPDKITEPVILDELSVVRVFVICPLVESVVKAPELAIVLPILPGETKVAPFRLDAFKLGTFVVLDTTKGAVPVETVEICTFALKFPTKRLFPLATYIA